MKVLVTGGAGLIGSHLAEELIAQGHQVTIADDLSGGFKENIPKKARFIYGDLRKRHICKRAVRKQEVIFHLAAYAAEGQSLYSPIEINQINIKPMNNLLVEAVNQNVRKFIFTSSMAVYGRQLPPFNEHMPARPVDPYGAAKAYCEEMLRVFHEVHGMRYTIIRPHNVYGPRQNLSDPYRNVIGIWMRRIMEGRQPLVYGDGSQTRAFSYVKDTTRAMAKCIDKADQEAMNIGGSKPYTINEACRLVLDVTGSRQKPRHIEGRHEVRHAYCTTSKSERMLQYQDTMTFKDGITLMWLWAKKKGKQSPSYRIPLEIKKGAPEVWIKQEM